MSSDIFDRINEACRRAENEAHGRGSHISAWNTVTMPNGRRVVVPSEARFRTEVDPLLAEARKETADETH